MLHLQMLQNAIFAVNTRWPPAAPATAGLQSWSLGFAGRQDFGQLAARAVDAIIAVNATDGLPPLLLDPETGAAEGSAPISLGARGDSYLEYLLKSWLVDGKTNSTLLR